MGILQSILENASVSVSGSHVFRPGLEQEIILFWNILGTITGGSPTITFSIQEVDPSDETTSIGSSISSSPISSTGAGQLTLPMVNSPKIKIIWTLGGSTPVFNNTSLIVASKTFGNKIATTVAELTQKQLYDIQSNVIYLGVAIQGSATSAPIWLIKKINLDVNGSPTSTLWSSTTAIWDNRTSETYQ